MSSGLSLKKGDKVRVITGEHRNLVTFIKKIDREKGLVYLEKISRMKFVLNKQEGKRFEKEIFIPISISNVIYFEESNL